MGTGGPEVSTLPFSHCLSMTPARVRPGGLAGLLYPAHASMRSDTGPSPPGAFPLGVRTPRPRAVPLTTSAMSPVDIPAFEPFDSDLVTARFLRRPNRFVVHAALEDGEEVRAHLPNPGRMEEILAAGRILALEPAPRADRKTDWSAILARTPDAAGWVSLVTTLPNRLVGEALSTRGLDELADWQLERSEPTLGGSRLDFLLSRDDRRMALEVKSVSLEREGMGLFPDAVTDRGRRHLRELAEIAGRDGWEAAVLFVAQRDDVRAVTAAPDIDPAFAEALDEAREAGVRILARRCRVTRRGVALGPALPTPLPEEAPPPEGASEPDGAPDGARPS